MKEGSNVSKLVKMTKFKFIIRSSNLHFIRLIIYVLFHHWFTQHFTHWSFHSLGISFIGHFIHLTFHLLGISFIWHFIHLTFHSFDISFSWHFIHLTFHSFYISFILHFIHLTFHSFYISFIWHFIHLRFHSSNTSFFTFSIYSFIKSVCVKPLAIIIIAIWRIVANLWALQKMNPKMP